LRSPTVYGKKICSGAVLQFKYPASAALVHNTGDKVQIIADIIRLIFVPKASLRDAAYQIMTLAIYNFSCDKMDHRYDDLLQFGRLQ
jgi:hypothetical protein